MSILVTGATGTVGRQVVNALVERGASVRALTRYPAKANFPAGVEVVAGDLTAPETVAPALEGVSAVHLITFGGDNYAPLQTAPEIIDLAARAGVRRVTVLRGGDPGPVEQAVEASALAWTHLMPVEFMSNALEWAEPIRTTGIVREGFASRRSAMVHEADIGAVAATVLLNDGHGGKSYVLTGPEVLTPPQMISTIGRAIGRDLQFVELTEAEARARWRDQGFPEEVIDYFVWMYGSTPEIGYTVVPTIQEVTGRPARTFAQWAAEHADAFRT